MKKSKSLLVVVLLSVVMSGCPPVQESARDTILTARAVIETAQNDFGTSCTADPTQRVCVEINRAVDAHNLAVDALDVYCSGQQWDAGGECQPPTDPATQQQFESKLRTAIRNLDSIIRELRGLTGR